MSCFIASTVAAAPCEKPSRQNFCDGQLATPDLTALTIDAVPEALFWLNEAG